MSFGWAGASAGASDALQQLLAQAFARKQQEEESARANAQIELQRAASKRADRAAQLGEAAATLEQLDALGQGAEVSPDIARVLSGTPYAARLESKTTLPSRSVAGFGPGVLRMMGDYLIQRGSTPLDQNQMVDFSSPGGRAYTTLQPTQAQMREQKQRTDLDAFSNDATLPPLMRRWVSARRAGLPVPNPESLETPAERSARLDVDRQAEFGDFTRRSDYTARINAQARRQAQIEAANAPITARDRREALRLADNAASDYLRSIQNDLGVLPLGVDPEGIRQRFIDEYMSSLESPSSPRNTQRGVERLRDVLPRPTRTGLMTGDYLVPDRQPTPKMFAAGDFVLTPRQPTATTPTAGVGKPRSQPQLGEMRIINGERGVWQNGPDGPGWYEVR